METCTTAAAGTQRDERADAAEGARVDALLREQLRDWSTPELEEYVGLADRDLGGYHAFCHDAAAAELDRRRREFDPDYFRYTLIEDGGEGLYAGTTDEQVRDAFKSLGVDEDDWDDERDAQAAWSVGQAEGARAETDE